MNFTREPIIETIISPKEGCKLLVRSSKSSSGSEEYYVDAVEVVSFGRAFFFRSMERPKAFLVPVSDYEVLEVKETRVALKNVTHDRNIKIGGGREAAPRHTYREPPQESSVIIEDEEQSSVVEEASLEPAVNGRMEKRRDRRRRRHRRSPEDQDWSERKPQQKEEGKPAEEQELAQGGGAEDETKVSSSMFSSLIPPPPTLISETLSRYKDKEFMEQAPPKKVERSEDEKPKKEPTTPRANEDESGSESTPLNRIATSSVSEHLEVNAFSSTHFSPLHGGHDSYFF